VDEREQPNWSAENQPGAAEVSERIRSVLSEAESAANAVRHQAEQQAQARMRAAETESLRIVEDARREAERFLAERIAVVSQLSDDLLKRGQALVERMDSADEVRGQLASLVLALGDTAARLANEVRAMPGPSTDAITGHAAPAPLAPSPVPAEPEVPAAEAPVDVAPVEPVPDLEPEPEADEPPLAEPTPLRPPVPEDEPPPAAAEAMPADDVEARLLDAARDAERDREIADDEPDSIDANVLADDEPEDDTSIGEAARAANAAAAAADVEAGTEIDEIVEIRAEAVVHGPDQALGARLVALQMAVAGGNRGEVEAHLRRAFELSDPADILDDIFGSGSDSDKRVVWPEAG
jgi:vacuolar-type H+-ATPase subunit H